MFVLETLTPQKQDLVSWVWGSLLRVLESSLIGLLFKAEPTSPQPKEASAWVNLVFGVGDRAVVPKRIRTILEMMGMQATLKLIEEDVKATGSSEGSQGFGYRTELVFRV